MSLLQDEATIDQPVLSAQSAFLSSRQPFRHFPQSLVLQETFTVDLRQGRYVLESKAILTGGKESVHILTLGYKPTGPYVSYGKTLGHETLYYMC